MSPLCWSRRIQNGSMNSWQLKRFSWRGVRFLLGNWGKWNDRDQVGLFDWIQMSKLDHFHPHRLRAHIHWTQRSSKSSYQIQSSWVHRHSDFFDYPLPDHFFSHEPRQDLHFRLHLDLLLFHSHCLPIWLNCLYCLDAFCSWTEIDYDVLWPCLGH